MMSKRKKKHDLMRALALVFKIAEGKSNDEMLSVYRTLIDAGVLKMRKVPHQNTLCRWMNDPALTPILQKMVELTAKPFRVVECAAIVDSSKMSQMRSAHSRWVEYGDDERDDADRMKMHALVGVETLVCMAVMFSGTNSGGGRLPVHDINFVLPLIEKTKGKFSLRYLLGDKAYLSEQVVGRLFHLGIQAVIPIKKGWDGLNMKQFYEPYQALVRWFDERQPDFHEHYRLRPNRVLLLARQARGGKLLLVARPAAQGRRRLPRRERERAVHRLDQRDAVQGDLRQPAPDRAVRDRHRLPDELPHRHVLPVVAARRKTHRVVDQRQRKTTEPGDVRALFVFCAISKMMKSISVYVGDGESPTF